MKKRILLAILTVARAIGMFRVARRLTTDQLRILCYHGIALVDEHRFRPTLFMRGETFAARMAYLAQMQYPVLTLDEGLSRLEQGTLPASSTVITIDDGWYGTFREMVPVLKEHSFPSTLYVASYYFESQSQVFDVALAYVLWKARPGRLNLADIAGELSGEFDLADPSQCDRACELLVEHANRNTQAAERQELLRKVSRRLGVAWDDVESSRVASFMNAEEARAALAAGVDLQLHTHNHRFPDDDFESARSEIEQNRSALASVTNKELKHFCYPSGVYSERQLPWLRRLSVETATTTKHGFNQRETSKLELNRFLDSENITMLEFEAELSGFFELVRRCGYSI
jgi:peptidoglycan/xylan/chitin deacetylase (PgdA/CDA1 family)